MSSTSELQARFKTLSDKKDSLNQELVQAETRLDMARTRYVELGNELKEKYKVSSLVEAQQLLSAMTADIEAKLTEAEQKLEKAL